MITRRHFSSGERGVSFASCRRLPPGRMRSSSGTPTSLELELWIVAKAAARFAPARVRKQSSRSRRGCFSESGVRVPLAAAVFSFAREEQPGRSAGPRPRQ
jgi:hypothetical protein